MSDGNETISDSELSGKIPQNIAFGTSTWTYPGWKGSVYKLEYETDKAFRRDSLREYAQFPLFRTVGIDSTFYQPASLELLKSYSSQVSSEFKWVSKVWERLTIPEFPRHKRYGSLAGQRNQDFLSSELFLKALAPLQDPAVINHLGPVVLQFPFIKQSSMGFDEFGDCLSRLLSSLSNSPFSCAVEIRNPDYLVTEYFKLLNTYNAAHCFNHWQGMPRLVHQMQAAAKAGGLQAPFYLARLLTPLNVSYEKAVELFSPYESIQRPNQEMRDDSVRLCLRAIETKRSAYVIVNNRSEGHAPGTIRAITKSLVKRLAGQQQAVED